MNPPLLQRMRPFALAVLLGLSPAAPRAATAASGSLASGGLAGLRSAAERCVAGATPQACAAALHASHQLKQRAEQQNKLSCYTQLLAVEAHLIIQSLDGNHGAESLRSLDEASGACGW